MNSSTPIDIQQLEKGYSSDQKYIVYFDKVGKLLLRIFDLKQLARKHSEFMALQKMEEYAVRCSRPLEIGKLDQLGKGYLLVSFLESKDAIDELPHLSDHEQFNIGVEAGKELLNMHHYQAPPSISSWYERKISKHRKYMEAYLDSDVKITNDSKIISFIENNIGLMKQRPNLFQHDDYHVGNIIVHNGQFAGVIDFDRYDWGDPIHEFLKVGMFSREVSIPFSIGQIVGYHPNHTPSEMFWRLYSLYLAMAVFSTVVWSLKIIPENMNEMLDKVYTVLEDHHYFTRIKPTWYEERIG